MSTMKASNRRLSPLHFDSKHAAHGAAIPHPAAQFERCRYNGHRYRFNLGVTIAAADATPS